MNLTFVTIIICALIIGIFFAFLRSAWKMKSNARIFQKALESDNILDFIAETKFKPLGEAYLSNNRIPVNGQDKINIPADVYFSNQSVCASAGINMKVLESGSGILVGLGLFGTFLGLTLGILGFKSTDSDQIQSSIQSLLGGMGTAFLTSLFGMAGSLIYSYFEKKWNNRLDNILFSVCEKIDSVSYIDDSSLSQYQHKKFVDDLYTRLALLLRNESNQIIKVIKTQSSYTNTDNKEVSVADAIREILHNNQEQTTALKSFSTDLALELNNGFDEVLSRQMQEKILPLMQNVDITTKAVVTHIDEMALMITSPATKMVNHVVKELSGSVNTMMDEFQTKLSNVAIQELASLAQSVKATTALMEKFPSYLENIMASFDQTVEDVKSMQKEIATTAESIKSSIGETRNAMIRISQVSETSSLHVVNTISTASSDMSNLLRETMQKIGDGLQLSMQSVTDGITSRQTDFMSMQESAITGLRETMDQLYKSSKASSLEVVENLQSFRKALVSDLNSSLDYVNHSITSTMDNVMDNIQKKQSSLNDSVEVMMQGLSERIIYLTDSMVNEYSLAMNQQKETIENSISVLQGFQQTLDSLMKANSSISSSLVSLTESQDHISTSVEQMKTIANQMKTSTEQFSVRQDTQTKQLVALETSSKEKIDTLINLMESMTNASKQQSEDFEVIRNGLGDVFRQIENGLTNYSSMVKSSMEDYLSAYMSSLTQTTSRLSSTINLQNSMVQDLTAMVEDLTVTIKTSDKK